MDKDVIKFKTNAKLFFILVFVWSIAFWSLTTVLGGIDQFPGSILLEFTGNNIT